MGRMAVTPGKDFALHKEAPNAKAKVVSHAQAAVCANTAPGSTIEFDSSSSMACRIDILIKAHE